MNTRLFLPALLAAAIASAQPAAPVAAPAKPDNPPAAPTEPKAEMQKWIEATDAQWQAAFKRDVTNLHEADLNKVKLQYLKSLEDGIKNASSGNDLKGALALRNEQKRYGDTNVFPEKDEDGDAPAEKAIRAATRAQLAKVAKDSAARAKALHAKYDQVLAQAQAQLTQRQRLDDALLVQNKRDEVSAAWLAGISASQPRNVKSGPAPREGDPNSTVPTKKVVPWIYLSDLKETSAKVGHGELVKGKLIYRNLKLSVGGVKPQHCLYAHAPSSIIYDLSGKGYRELKGKAAIADGYFGEVQFVIIGDTKEIWRSAVIKKENPRANPKILPFEVDITGIAELELKVDPLGSQDSDHSVWLDPQIGAVR